MSDGMGPPCKHSSLMNPYPCDSCEQNAKLRAELDKARNPLVTSEGDIMKDFARVIEERDRLILQIREAAELADHYTGTLWPSEVNRAGREILKILRPTEKRKDEPPKEFKFTREMFEKMKSLPHPPELDRPNPLDKDL